MDLKTVLSLPQYPGDFLHPVVYACTAVMLLCLLASVVTYLVHRSAIRISRKGRHVLLNFCLHAGVTVTAFAGGVNRTQNPVLCQAVGMVLHYSSLSSMLWIGVAASHIYQQVTKKGPSCPAADPALTPQQPLLRFYLIGGGVPFIICGVTAATNIHNYGKEDEGTAYCWMSWEPSLGAFYGPVAFTALVTCGLLLGSYVQLRRHPERRYELRERPQEPARRAGGTGDTGPCPRPSPGALPCPLAASLLQNEHSLAAQLRAAAFTLFLFTATWAFGALAVSQGPLLDMVFSCLYGAFCVSLGLFVLIHHCAKREDVWHCWWSCCPRRARPGPDAAREALPATPLPATPDPTRGRHKAPALQAAPSQARCLSPVTPCCAQLAREQLLDDSVHLHLHEGLCDHGLCNHGLSDHRLCDHGLSDHGLCDHGLSDHGLCDHGLSDHGLCDHGLCDHDLHLHGNTCAHDLHLPEGLCDHGLSDHGLCDHGLCEPDLHLPGDACGHEGPLHGCQQPRTPPSFFSRHQAATQDYIYHVQPSPDGSAQSSCSDSPSSSLACCALAEPFPLNPVAAPASPPSCSCAVGPTHLEMLHRTQPLPLGGPGQNGGLKGEVPGARRYETSSPNFRTGPWRNETTV